MRKLGAPLRSISAKAVLISVVAALGLASAGTAMASTNRSTKPSAPRDAHAAISKTSARVSWRVPRSNAATTTYKVTSHPGTLWCITPETTCIVHDLKKNTSYTFRVVATNRAGAGPASAPSNAVIYRVPTKPTSTPPVVTTIPTTVSTTTTTLPASTSPPTTTTTTLPPATTTTTTTTVPPTTTTTTTTPPPTTTTTTTTLPTTTTTAPNYYTVTFDSNDGTGDTTSETSNSPEPLLANTFTNPGYSITGWGTSPSNPGTVYSLGATYSFEADLTLYADWLANAAPAVTLSPQSTLSAGSVTFSAAATGGPAPSVQWDVSSNGGGSWSPVRGATNDSYTLTASLANNGYEYEAVFSNTYGVATSAPAQLTYLTSSHNWAGYIDTGGTFSAVSGSWTVPTLRCPNLASSAAVQWVGIDGYTSSTVEQDGTSASCVGTTPSYNAWYEMYGDASVNGGFQVTLSSSLYPVLPGDTINAAVTLTGSEWTLSLSDATSGWVFSKTIASPTPAPAANSAEWIVESPDVCNTTCVESPLADFGTVTFTNASATSSLTGTGSIDVAPVTAMEATDHSGIVMMTPGLLNSSGTSFTDTWFAGS